MEAACTLQRLHDTARLLRARVCAPLWKAAASRPERSARHHDGADISLVRRNVKGACTDIHVGWVAMIMNPEVNE